MTEQILSPEENLAMIIHSVKTKPHTFLLKRSLSKLTSPNSARLDIGAAVVALFDYPAERTDELTLQVGDRFKVLQLDMGWFFVAKEGSGEEKGWIPAGCLIADKERPLDFGPTQCKGVVRKGYEQCGDHEITVKAGNKLVIRRRYEGWTLVDCEDQRGWVPQQCIEETEQAEVPSNPVITNRRKANIDHTGAIKKSLDNIKMIVSQDSPTTQSFQASDDHFNAAVFNRAGNFGAASNKSQISSLDSRDISAKAKLSDLLNSIDPFMMDSQDLGSAESLISERPARSPTRPTPNKNVILTKAQALPSLGNILAELNTLITKYAEELSLENVDTFSQNPHYPTVSEPTSSIARGPAEESQLVMTFELCQSLAKNFEDEDFLKTQHPHYEDIRTRLVSLTEDPELKFSTPSNPSAPLSTTHGPTSSSAPTLSGPSSFRYRATSLANTNRKLVEVAQLLLRSEVKAVN